VLLGVPLASLVWRAGLIPETGSWSLTTLLSHVRLVERSNRRLLGESLFTAAAAGVACAGLALTVCWAARSAPRFRGGVLALMAVAWAMPGPVVGFGLKSTLEWIVNGSGSEVLDRLLWRGPSPLPVTWVDVIRFFPCAVALLWPVVRLLPAELSDAARVDGATPGRELVTVVWPLMAPACLRAGLAVAVLSLGELSAGKIAKAIGSPTFAESIFTQMHYGVTNNLAAQCLLLLAAVLAGAVCVAAFGRRSGDGLPG
jgi:ABC-type Fe3+ transport system permease subunit